MKTAPDKRQIAVVAFLIFILHVYLPPAGESGNCTPHATRLSPGKMVRLQIHISKATRRKDMLRYYKSIARRQKGGATDIPAPRVRTRPSGLPLR